MSWLTIITAANELWWKLYTNSPSLFIALHPSSSWWFSSLAGSSAALGRKQTKEREQGQSMEKLCSGCTPAAPSTLCHWGNTQSQTRFSSSASTESFSAWASPLSSAPSGFEGRMQIRGAGNRLLEGELNRGLVVPWRNGRNSWKVWYDQCSETTSKSFFSSLHVSFSLQKMNLDGFLISFEIVFFLLLSTN